MPRTLPLQTKRLRSKKKDRRFTTERQVRHTRNPTPPSIPITTSPCSPLTSSLCCPQLSQPSPRRDSKRLHLPIAPAWQRPTLPSAPSTVASCHSRDPSSHRPSLETAVGLPSREPIVEKEKVSVPSRRVSAPPRQHQEAPPATCRVS